MIDLYEDFRCLGSTGIMIENKSNNMQKTQPTKESTSSASRSLAADQAPTVGTSKKRSAADVSPAIDSQSSSPPESFGGDRRKPRIERASQGLQQPAFTTQLLLWLPTQICAHTYL